jgi:nucleotide-binding universal stress UspA family protein
MKNLRKILAYIDTRPESVAALEHAVSLAARTGASVTALDVVQAPRRHPPRTRTARKCGRVNRPSRRVRS